MGLSVWAGMHQDLSTGGPAKPCQSRIIGLGPNAMPKELAVFCTLANLLELSESVAMNQIRLVG